MTESMLDTSSQPGLILKTAREEMSLTIEQVAQELHLRPAVVKAIEEEKYSEFSSDVFLKGYFRTYCRLVKLHEERMIELLEKQLNSIKEASNKSQEELIKAKQSKKRRKQILTIIIFLACASVVYLVYLASTQSISLFSDETETVQTTEKQNSQTIESDPLTPPDLEIDEEEADTVINENSLNNDTDSFPETIDQAELKANVQAEEAPEEVAGADTSPLTESSDISSKNLDSEQANINDEQDLEQIAPVISDSAMMATLQASFTGDCWFKLTDGTGKTAIADLKRENDQINYQGIPPFHIVIGDASTASLTFNGKIVDLAKYSSRNGRAEIQLNTKDGLR